MREILFRGKTLTGKWVEGAYYKQEEFYGDKEDAHIIITSKETLDNDFLLEYVVVIPETIGQYTGLTDKNGKKIFEGDIIAVTKHRMTYINGKPCYKKISCTEIIEIEFTPSGLSLLDYICRKYDFEVIGNIHDNPELIERRTGFRLE